MTPESKDFTEWILSNEYKKYPPQAETYGDNQKNIYRYIKLENYREEFKKILGIDMGLYQGEYKDDKFDHLIDPDWMKNPEIISNYNEFEKVSFDLFGYKMIEL